MVKRQYLSSLSPGKLHPWFVTGFTDGEGSFSIRLRKKSSSLFGFHTSIVYSIGAEINPLNLNLLEKVKDYFGGAGSISKSGNMYIYEVSSLKALIDVRAHFEKFPLQTTKFVHFKLWCQVMDIFINKEHLTSEGFYKILSIKSVFPKGLSSNLTELFPKGEIIPIIKPSFEVSSAALDKNWIVGFAQADGTFGLNYTKQTRMKLGYTCLPQFRITQHERDLAVLNRIIATLGCGVLVKPSGSRDRYTISVANISDLVNIVIPLFEECPIYGAKNLDFLDFCKGIHIIKKKGAFDLLRVKWTENFSLWNEYIQKVLMILYRGVFIFNIVYFFVTRFRELMLSIVCRWLMWINQLLYRCLLEQLYNKFIHIFAALQLRYKMYKKILGQLPEIRETSGGWMVNQQVTLSSLNNGTSETSCDMTFIFDNYLNQKIKHKKINKRFLEWFIGFTEGKGSFIVLKNKVYFDISVSIKDIQVIYYIKKELGFGKVIRKDLVHQNDPLEQKVQGSDETVSFYVTSEDNFSRLVSLFNGNLCTVNKKQDFKNWLEIFNKQYSKDILYIPRDIKPSLNTGWFSGYIDATAEFNGLIENKGLNSLPPYIKPYRGGLVQAPLYLTFSIFIKEFYILNDISVMLNIKDRKSVV